MWTDARKAEALMLYRINSAGRVAEILSAKYKAKFTRNMIVGLAYRADQTGDNSPKEKRQPAVNKERLPRLSGVRRIRVVVKPLPPPPLDEPEAIGPIGDFPDDTSETRGCRNIKDAGTPRWRCCGQPVRFGSSFCAYHDAKNHQVGSARPVPVFSNPAPV